MPSQAGHEETLMSGRILDYRGLVADLSEPESGPGADNLTTNEDSFTRVAGDLARRAPRGGVYIGVGPDQNFTFIARARPGLAFIVDFRRRNLLLHLVHKALFSLSADRVAYLSRLTARAPKGLAADPTAEALVEAFEAASFERGRLDAAVAEVADFLRPLGLVDDEEWPALATIQAKLAGPGMEARFLALPIYPTLGRLILTPDRDGRPAHMLSDGAFYEVVRRAQLSDRVVPLVGDFAGDLALPRLAGWLRGRGLAVSVLYIADVEFFLLRAGQFDAYAANLDRIPWAEGALIVRTSTREIDHPSRVEGDSATTIARPVAPFLEAALAGRIRGVDDLFDG